MTVNQVTPLSLESIVSYKMDSTQTPDKDINNETVETSQKNEEKVVISQEAKDLNNKRVEEKEARLNGQAQAADDMRNKSKGEEDLAMEKMKEEKENTEKINEREMMAKQFSQITNIYNTNNETTALGSTIDNIA